MVSFEFSVLEAQVFTWAIEVLVKTHRVTKPLLYLRSVKNFSSTTGNLSQELTFVLPEGLRVISCRLDKLEPPATFYWQIFSSERSEEMAILFSGIEVWKKIVSSEDMIKPYVLTTREMEVLQLIAQGCTDKEIAHGLGLSIYTANKHVGNVLHKMGVASRSEAASRALREGWVK